MKTFEKLIDMESHARTRPVNQRRAPAAFHRRAGTAVTDIRTGWHLHRHYGEITPETNHNSDPGQSRGDSGAKGSLVTC